MGLTETANHGWLKHILDEILTWLDKKHTNEVRQALHLITVVGSKLSLTKVVTTIFGNVTIQATATKVTKTSFFFFTKTMIEQVPEMVTLKALANETLLTVANPVSYASIFAQHGLEMFGYKTTGKAVGIIGNTVSGALTGKKTLTSETINPLERLVHGADTKES